MTDPRQSISNDAFAPGQFEESSTDEEFLDPFEEEEPEDGVDPVSRQLMREASEPRRSQRPNTRKDYLDIATSGKRKATPQKTANTTIQYYDDDIYDEEEETPRLFGFLMLEASNLADTKFEIPSSWYKAKNMANYRSFWRPAELKELQKIQEKECWTLEILPDGAKVFDGRWVYTIKYPIDGEPYAKARWVARGDQHAEVFEHEDLYAAVAHLVSLRVFCTIVGVNDFDWEHLMVIVMEVDALADSTERFTDFRYLLYGG
ncbi:uncharacterized protein CPUR_03124 [Claviceps purpurea 20.1]|uniref:Reverse transcriptase Ty1/copia-type domain-containing protein n=1 Tax=Claviceps purpurea (strain 20.1) TaxID=1111077 RepID=M1W0G9_CLAP2|nr:uncharacterized protein CPUR_03124 [Claviceps purpurea 20.1]